MGDDGGDVDPTSLRSESHYGRFRDSPWYYANGELAQTFILGPTAGTEPGDDWILSFTGEGAAETDHKRVCVRLMPRASYEPYTKTRGLSPDARQTGYTVRCDLRGESVPLEKAVSNKREEPVHKRRYVDVYDEPIWMEDYWAGLSQQSDVPIGRCWLRVRSHRE